MASTSTALVVLKTLGKLPGIYTTMYFIATFFANYHIPNSDFTLGVGTYTPFGLATSYKEDAITRFAAIRSELKNLYISPTAAWSLFPMFPWAEV